MNFGNVILFLFIFIIFIFLILNMLYLKTNHNHHFFDNAKKFSNGVPNNLEMVCVGSSYAKYDIDFSVQKKDAFNFGISPQSIHYSLKMLKQYKLKFSVGCNVLIILAPFSFAFIDYENNVRNLEYYKFLDKSYILNYRLHTKINHIILPLIATPKLVKYIKKDIPFSNDYLKTYICEDYTKNEAEIRKKGWCKEFGLYDLKLLENTKYMKNIFMETKKYLAEMIELSINQGCKPILVIPPVSGVLYNLFSKDFLENYLYKNIREANIKNVPVFNYLDQEEFWKFSYYSNSDFMNQRGRRFFSKKLFSDLKKKI